MEKLQPKQQAYYDERVAFFKTLKAGGRKIAIPTGMLYDISSKMTDEECDICLKNKLMPS